MSDKNFMQNNAKIVTASPYRAVVRRQEQPYQLQQSSREDSEEEEENDMDAQDDFERDDPLDMGATNAEMYIQSQDHQTTYPPPLGDADGPGQGLNLGQASSDGRDAEKEPSMYSYSKVSRDLKEESYMMRQMRDQALTGQSQSRRINSPSSLGGLGFG